MKIGGFQKFSLIDYPGRPSAIIFTLGCNFKCPFCHNPELVLPELFKHSYSEEDIIEFLIERVGFLEGVVISGGEPTIQKNLIPFLKTIKTLKYSIKLDTNGSHPDVLIDLIDKQLVDYIAMDIKAPLKKYHCLSGVDINVDNIETSIQIVENSGVNYEFRTTLTKPLLKCYDLLHILSLIKHKEKLVVKKCIVSEKIMEKDLSTHEQYTDNEIKLFKNQLALFQ